MLFRKETPPVTSIESIFIKVSGMRFRCEYEVSTKDGNAKIELYQIKIRDKQDVRELEASAQMPLDEMLGLCNRCEIMRWDGFFGAHPKNVRDGEMFDLEASLNGGVRVRAEGSANFPKHYNEFMHELDKTLRETAQGT